MKGSPAARRSLTVVAFVLLVVWYWASVIPPPYDEDADVDALLVQERNYCVEHHEPSEESSAHGLTCDALERAYEALIEGSGS